VEAETDQGNSELPLLWAPRFAAQSSSFSKGSLAYFTHCRAQILWASCRQMIDVMQVAKHGRPDDPAGSVLFLTRRAMMAPASRSPSRLSVRLIVKSLPRVAPPVSERMSLILTANPFPEWGHASRRTGTPPNSALSQRDQSAVRLCGWGQCCARFCSLSHCRSRSTL
jgi:hypothetical protein